MGNYFITGANGGMGAAIHWALSQAGHHVWGIDRFKRIVGRVEARYVGPEKIAAVVQKALAAQRPRLVYCVNRNPLLPLNALPKRLQLLMIRKILE